MTFTRYMAIGKGVNARFNRAFRDLVICQMYIDRVAKVHKVKLDYIGAPEADILDEMFAINPPEKLEQLFPQLSQSFKVTSGKLRVTDPCYGKDVWCTYVLDKVLNGTWKFELKFSDEKDWGVRVSELIVWNEDGMPYSKIDMLNWKKVEKAHIGVDSGQAGFFDEALYVGGEDEKFYETIGEGTLGARRWGKVDFGVASRAGYGDGSYNLYVDTTPQGTVFAAKIVFIGDEEDEEDYEDDDADN